MSPSKSQGEEDAPHISRNKIPLNEITKELVERQIPFCETLRSLGLGFNADASQGKTDIQVFNMLLRYMPNLEEFSMAQPLDDLSLFKNLAKANEDDSSVSGLQKVRLTMNNECGMSKGKVESELRRMLPRLKEVEVEIDNRESCFYLNQARDRRFQTFLRRFGGNRR